MRKSRILFVVAALATALAGAVLGSTPASAAAADDSTASNAATASSGDGGQASSAPDTNATNESDKPDPDHDCGEVGPNQKEVESILDELGDYGQVFVDGEQSVQDCKAIKKFQKRMGIDPDAGYAGPITSGIGNRLIESSLDDCEVGEGNTVCVDLTHQTLWVLDADGKRVFEPTVIRTGMKGYATTAGTHQINVRETKHWSKPYEVWLPYWQHFHDGEGLHETTTYLHDSSIGSHGCVNLLPADAEEIYGLLDYNDTVEVFGKRSGT